MCIRDRENTKYVLRTYFANEEGGADYLIDEQEVTDASKISVTIPQSGACLLYTSRCV